jgi:2-polyprenyl-6-methoxyphenol hydroxylase-like FAD-dependent oxidoreductase
LTKTQVLIAGGGPVGMTLARTLSSFGVRCLLVERNPTTTRHPKMDITNGRSMELFRRLGVAGKLRAVAVPEENNFDISWITSLAPESGGRELHRFRYPSVVEKRAEIRAKRWRKRAFGQYSADQALASENRGRAGARRDPRDLDHSIGDYWHNGSGPSFERTGANNQFIRVQGARKVFRKDHISYLS